MANGTGENQNEGQQFSRQSRRTARDVDQVTSKIEQLKKASGEVGHGFDGMWYSAKQLSKTLSENAEAIQKIKQGQLGVNEAQKIQSQIKQHADALDKKAINLSKKLSRGRSQLNAKERKELKGSINLLRSRGREANNMSKRMMSEANKRSSVFQRGWLQTRDYIKNLPWGSVKAGMGKVGSGFSHIAKKGKGVASMLSGLITSIPIVWIFKKMFDAFKRAGNEVSAIGRQMSVSAEEAHKIRQHFVNIANSSDNFRNTYVQIMQAQMAFQESLGVATKYISGDILDGMATLKNMIGLSDVEMVNFGKSALATGKSVEDLERSAIRGMLATSEEFKVRVKFPKLMKAVGNVTGQVRAIMGANFELMGKTVAKAQLLGLEMKDVANSSRQMLNFQDSIEKEMKAELFLGKQLNLERARLAALTGDYDTYMDEIVKNAGDFYEFSKLNVLQQEALAAPLGMTADALADMLLQREDLAALQEKAIADGEDEIANLARQLSLQEQMAAVWEKLQNILVNLMAKLEESIMTGDNRFFNMIGLNKDFWKDITAISSEGDVNESGDDVSNTEIKGRVRADDFVIKTHPKDTFVMAGGTRLGGNNGMTPNQANELIRVSKMNRVFSYDGFAAVKEAGHYGTKFS